MKFEPLGKFVLVELVKPPSQIELPNSVANPTAMRIVRVVAVGPGLLVQDGTRVPIDVQPEDEVLLPPEAQLISPDANFYDVEPGRYHLVSGEHIVAKVTGRSGGKLPKILKGELVA